MPPLSTTDRKIAEPIACILSDVDGVMCDGAITYDSAGIETKSFHVRDGLGIKLWMRAGFQFGIITARQSEIVARRADELGILQVRQNESDKWAAAQALMQTWRLNPDQVAYIGDDLPDLAVMHRIGLSVAPADAARDVLESADWVMRSTGGAGVIRELVERLLRSTDRWSALVPKIVPTDGSLIPGADGTSC